MVQYFIAQIPTSLWSTTGSVTVVGVLLVLIALLISGYLSPPGVVKDLKEENVQLRIELAAVNSKYIEKVHQIGHMNGEMEALKERLEGVERELSRLRGKLGEGA